LLIPIRAPAQPSVQTGVAYGPFHGSFLAGGEGISERIQSGEFLTNVAASWTVSAWIRPAEIANGTVPLFAFGDVDRKQGRVVALIDGKPAIIIGDAVLVRSSDQLGADAWSLLVVSHDKGALRIWVDGAQVAEARAELTPVTPMLHIAPASLPEARHFGGQIADLKLIDGAIPELESRRLVSRRPEFSLINFYQVSVGWPWQTKQLTGLAAPQAPATLPRSNAPFAKPAATKNVNPGPRLLPRSANTWTVHGWRMIDAPSVSADAAAISTVGFDDKAWHVATVPGTVLTTLIDRGVYADPDYGLNNLSIPESLNKQDYWYRVEFPAPAHRAAQRLTLTFNGINYQAEAWLNGRNLGAIKGAFIRGVFDVTEHLRKEGSNSLAVRISPPPHPGIPHEQSIKAGPGENGGALALDGPTFIAIEGWDWIPAVRDRNTGLWRDVVLSATGPVSIGDPQVVTTLPLPATDRAEVEINVPLRNVSMSPIRGALSASFGDVIVKKQVELLAGESTVRLLPAEFDTLRLKQPRLWWPNGYGRQELYDLKLEFSVDATVSDVKSLRFGIRHVTYELSLFDEKGHLRRVAVNPSVGRARGERLIDVRHEALKKSPKGWAASLYPGKLQSPGVQVLDNESMTPHLVLLVNGVRIASRGGNWGMDDSRKRVSRAKLEPYFRLHREANLNTIRNWVGQNTEEEFFELADEYGMLVLNDFWASTQDFQVEPEDAALFLANARDTISRYRNHPSIVLWFGRNEGVPQPILNSGLADLVAELDGTRHFTGSSNRVNLAGSGPYNYRPPVQYFNELAEGYSVEVGTPSLSTLESIRAWTPAADQWPISDALAYHDWHHGGNGDTATFMKTLAAQFGAPRDLADFERKAQMMNYVTHRAMFEGFHAHLWSKNSGRLLWMTHPAWPSHAWQIYSSDYDTHAAFYGVKKACEPVHVQMNLPGFDISVVNTTTRDHSGLQLRTRVLSLDNRLLDERRSQVDAPANKSLAAGTLDLQPHLQAHRLVMVKLELSNADGQVLSENFYWQGQDETAHQRLNELATVEPRVEAQSVRSGDEMRVRAKLENTGTAAALATKVTLLDANGQRILPAYYSDNYVSLLPGESRVVEISYPASAGTAARLAVRGWNISSREIRISAAR
jgi:beta-galactosidase/beta-glucuronidase